MSKCFFVSDLHGRIDRYTKMFSEIQKEKPDIVFMGGDLLPRRRPGFVNNYLVENFLKLKSEMRKNYPLICIILGNDDPRSEESSIKSGDNDLWKYVHNRRIKYEEYQIYGYSYIPPTPFMLKDWELYDVSRYVDVGSISPTQGIRTVSVPDDEILSRTIKNDLKALVGSDDLSKSVFLFHAPPYGTGLDRAGLDDIMIDGAPLDLHIGSIAIKEFIKEKQPLVTMHGHVHESSGITGQWYEEIGNTYSFSAAYDRPDLAIVKFSLDNPAKAVRVLV